MITTRVQVPKGWGGLEKKTSGDYQPNRSAGVSKVGPRCEDRTHFESFTNAGEWDHPEWREGGHPRVLVRHAYNTAWAQAVRAGLPLVDAREYAEAEAARVAGEGE